MTLHSVLFFYIWAAGLGGRLLASDSRNGDGAFANKNCPQGRACDQFFQMLGVFPEVCRGGDARGCNLLAHYYATNGSMMSRHLSVQTKSEIGWQRR